MKIGLPRRRIARAAIYLICLTLVLIAIDLVLITERRIIHPGFDTTRITGPTLPDGSVDYIAAVDEEFGRGVTPENNAAIPFILAAGSRAVPINQAPDGITDRIGMAHLPEKGDYFVDYAPYRKAHKLDEDIDYSLSFNWPVEYDQPTLEWIQSNEKPLTLIIEASKRPRFFIPWEGGNRPSLMISIPLNYLNIMRVISNALIQRAMIRLHDGDVTGCVEDTLTVHRLARLVGTEPTFIERLVACGMESTASLSDQLAARSGKLSADQARSLAAKLKELKDLPAISQAMNTERFMILDVIQAMSLRSPFQTWQILQSVLSPERNQVSDSLTPIVGFLPIPYEDSMRAVNQYCDGLLSTASHSSYSRQMTDLDALDKERSNLTPRFPYSLLTKNWPVQILMISGEHLYHTADKATMQRELAEVALALAAFKADHNAYPAKLSELAPSEIETVPEDMFSNNPLIYSRTEKGYLLYSVGPNMKDDGGKFDEARQGWSIKDDIAVEVP